MKLFRYGLSHLLLVVFLAACGGGGGDAPAATFPPQPPALTAGMFLDSAVEGLTYQSGSNPPGTTDENGTFMYTPGEPLTFSIGGVDLGTFPDGAPVITPFDFGDPADPADSATINIARFLQTLDADGDPSNGIDLTVAGALLAEIIVDDTVFLSDATTFETAIAPALEVALSLGAALIDEITALANLVAATDSTFDVAELAGHAFVAVFPGEDDIGIMSFAPLVNSGDSGSTVQNFFRNDSLDAGGDGTVAVDNWSVDADGVLTLTNPNESGLVTVEKVGDSARAISIVVTDDPGAAPRIGTLLFPTTVTAASLAGVLGRTYDLAFNIGGAGHFTFFPDGTLIIVGNDGLDVDVMTWEIDPNGVLSTLLRVNDGDLNDAHRLVLLNGSFATGGDFLDFALRTDPTTAELVLEDTFESTLTPAAPSANATLSSLALGSGELDQIFQPTQTDYTAGVGFLLGSIHLNAPGANPGAIVHVNGTTISAAGIDVSLAQGSNTIQIVTTEDGFMPTLYTLTVTRETSAQFAQTAYIKASNTDFFGGDLFGWSVALSGDTLAVGADGEDSATTGVDGDQGNNSAGTSGAVYVFTRDVAGVWSQQAYIKASNTDSWDLFGYSVALSGDTLAVGAYFEDSAATGIDGDQSDNSAASSGAAYVFTRDDVGVWSQQAYVKASNTDDGDQFGWTVALSGDTLAVGAHGEDSAATGINGDQSDDSAAFSGAVYVFTRNDAGVWSQQAYIKASNTDEADLFGHSVTLSGDTLAVGAELEDSVATGVDGDQGNIALFDAGAVYVFTRDGAGVWSQQAYIKSSNTQADGTFGWSVALSGDTLAVGAFGEEGSRDISGTAYVFTRDGAGVWSQQARIKASNTNGFDFFGWSVALSGETLAVGAHGEGSAATGIDGDQSDNSAANAGAVYVFTHDSAGVWSQQAYIKASNTDQRPNTSQRDFFGWSVALSGDTLAVGAQGEDSAATAIGGDQSDDSAFAAGAVYVFE